MNIRAPSAYCLTQFRVNMEVGMPTDEWFELLRGYQPANNHPSSAEEAEEFLAGLQGIMAMPGAQKSKHWSTMLRWQRVWRARVRQYKTSYTKDRRSGAPDARRAYVSARAVKDAETRSAAKTPKGKGK